MSKCEKKIVDYISTEKGILTEDVEVNKSVFECGYIDSLGFYKFCIMLESEFNVIIDVDDIIDSEILSIEELCRIINKKAI
jgi:acyl carrier protein